MTLEDKVEATFTFAGGFDIWVAPNPSATCWREKIVMRPEIPFDGTDVSCLQKGQAIEEDDVDVDDRVWIS